jgi:aryl-alcohol dehydrogenase-like predicted oxidoreductase
MEYRNLGGDGPRVSALCLGTMFFGTTVDEPTSMRILDRFAEAGGTFIDTADSYAFWVGGTGDESEELVGRWLANRGARDRTVVATKVGARPESPGASWPEHAEGLSAKAIRAGAEASLRRLGTDRIDLYYSHMEDRSVPLEETVEAFNSLVNDGLIGMPGASNHPAWRLERARRLARDHGWAPYRAIQQQHSYLRPRPGSTLTGGPGLHASDELLDYVRAEDDLTLLAYSPLLGGAYTRSDKPLPGEYDHPGTTERLAALTEVAAELGATPNQVVLAWLLATDPPAIPVIGVSSVRQLDEALGALDVNLDAGTLSRLG